MVIPKINCRTMSEPQVWIHAESNPKQSWAKIAHGLPWFAFFTIHTSSSTNHECLSKTGAHRPSRYWNELTSNPVKVITAWWSPWITKTMPMPSVNR
jgi:hypothetical protein